MQCSDLAYLLARRETTARVLALRAEWEMRESDIQGVSKVRGGDDKISSRGRIEIEKIVSASSRAFRETYKADDHVLPLGGTENARQRSGSEEMDHIDYDQVSMSNYESVLASRIRNSTRAM